MHEKTAAVNDGCKAGVEEQRRLIASGAAAVAFGAGQVIGVLTGAHDEHTLHDAGATSVINSVADLKTLI